MEDTPDLSIVIVSFNTKELLLRCLDSIIADKVCLSTSLETGFSTHPDYRRGLLEDYSNNSVRASDRKGASRESHGLQVEVFVVDNASQDGSAEEVSRRYPEVNLIRNTENVGFARANNQALREAKGRYVILLNSDTEIRSDTLRALSQFMDAHPEAGAVAPKLIYADGTPQPSVDFFPNLLTEFFHLFQLKKILPTASLRKQVGRRAGYMLGRTARTYLRAYDDASDPIEVDCASGGCLMVKREVISKVGLLDESFFIFVEDMDWCIRMKQAGFKTYYLPQVMVVHHVGKSVTVDKEAQERAFVEHYRSRLYFFKKHRGVLARSALRIMMAFSFSLRWLLITFLRIGSKGREELKARQKMYGQVVKVALR